jgi:hypothetical protein
MTVWTTNGSGKKLAKKIVRLARIPVKAAHFVTHLVTLDGRELFVSPDHPTADGQFVRNLSKGSLLDGSLIVSANLIRYQNKFTYDLLPDGDAGFYFANDILMGSTLSGKQKTQNPLSLHPKSGVGLLEA